MTCPHIFQKAFHRRDAETSLKILRALCDELWVSFKNFCGRFVDQNPKRVGNRLRPSHSHPSPRALSH